MARRLTHSKSNVHEDPSTQSVSIPKQTSILLRRHGALVFRDPMIYFGRCIMFLLANSFFAVIYWKSRERVQEQILFKLFLILWHIALPSSLGVIAVYAYNEEYLAIRKEVKNGCFRPIAYLTANFIIQIPFLFVLSVFGLLVSAYGIGNWNIESFGLMVVVYAMALFAFECLAQVFSVLFRNPLLGMLVYMNRILVSPTMLLRLHALLA